MLSNISFPPKMFLIEKHSSPFSFFFPQNPKNPPPNSFEQTLIARLNSLQFPDSPTSIPLSHLPLFIHLLTLTLTDLTAIISHPSSLDDHTALSSHLDSTISLLDACNAISATLDQFLHGCLFVRHAIRLISSSRLLRARSAIAAADFSPSDSPDLRRLPANGPDRGRKVTAVRGAVYAVEAVADLVVRLTLAFLGEKDDFLLGVFVSGDLAWGAAYNGVAAKVAGWICRGGIGGEIAVVKRRVKKLKVVVDEDGGDRGVTEGLRDAVCGAEEAVEELTEGMEGLGKAVSALFRSGLESREAALQCFRVWDGRCN